MTPELWTAAALGLWMALNAALLPVVWLTRSWAARYRYRRAVGRRVRNIRHEA